MGVEKLGVMTSGGDSPGMNAAIRAVVHTAAQYEIQCFGIRLGYKGLIEGDVLELETKDVRNILHRGGTFLKTARSDKFRTFEGRKKAYENIQKYKMEGLIIIGGDGSFTGAKVFGSEYDIPIIGIPGTIDNDIYGTDFTVGYDTALNTVVNVIDKIVDTATSHNRLFFIEVMGRDSGFIALNSGIATGALDILIPEKDYTLDKLFSSVERGSNQGKSSRIIVVAEGKKLGRVYALAKATQIKFPYYDIRVSILGHVQRGGNPSCYDRVLASRFGVEAVEALLHGKREVLIGIRSGKIIFTTFEEAIQKQKEINKDIIKILDVISV
ncbi:6-phosphofructokinase [Candidatus Walczuchella monophlebidarum]|uniref:ATP-dependent 6-phosphofructokinase n=1 Tax=Candidatus Walczuchella monophlebidarum TaxID=1415657 RepID=A0A068DQA3_9FLAO|nr:6-phosphofructokinase [Candidatus Walczuchella monophlebidarum]AID37402.1 6-phosphofructokinase [Candidatus Walczuchella monophlebidarum]